MKGARIKSILFDEAGGCKVDGDARIIEFHGSVFGNRDSTGETVDRGAFAKTIRERHPKKLIKVFRNHWDPVGMPIELREDDYGLFCRARIDRTPVGDECLEQCMSGTLAHASFMYRVLQSRREDAGGEETVHLTELKLFETGPVNFPANELAVILAASKADRPNRASLIDFALADLLEPARAGLAAMADREHFTEYERGEIGSALKDLRPFIQRLEEIEARCSSEGPDPATGTTPEEKQGPESTVATTPESGRQLAQPADIEASRLCAAELMRALEATQRIAGRRAA